MFYSKKFRGFKELKHCFFSRKGGFSKGLYRSLNCGKGSKDNKKNINKNINFVSKKIGVKRLNLILMHQTHSNRVFEIKKKYYKRKIFSDAIITKIKGVAIGVLTADCVPILLFDKKSKIIGCIHAGWKGALSGIIKNTIKKIKIIGGSNKIFAAVGPCIGSKNYEVDRNFYKKFTAESKKNKKYFKKKNKYKDLFDLRGFVTDKLLELEVKVDQVNMDTFKDNINFFSFRRSSILKQKDYGRCISVIKII